MRSQENIFAHLQAQLVLRNDRCDHRCFIIVVGGGGGSSSSSSNSGDQFPESFGRDRARQINSIKESKNSTHLSGIWSN